MADATSLDTLDTAARIRFLVTRIHRLLRQHSAGGLTLSQVSTLATVNRQGPITLGELAQAERVAPPTITKMVRTLEGLGLVARSTDRSDRRVTHLRITPEGEAHLAELREQRTAWLATRLDELDPFDLARLADALDVLERIAADPDAPDLRPTTPSITTLP